MRAAHLEAFRVRHRHGLLPKLRNHAGLHESNIHPTPQTLHPKPQTPVPKLDEITQVCTNQTFQTRVGAQQLT